MVPIMAGDKVKKFSLGNIAAITVMGFLALAAGQSYGGGAPDKCGYDGNVKMFFGLYTVVDVQQYRKPVMYPEDYGIDRLGGQVTVNEELFSWADVNIMSPVYQYDCVKIGMEEGVVPSRVWSNFYGFQPERTYAGLLQIYESQRHSQLKGRFEILPDGRLLQHQGPWFFILERK